MANEIPSTDSTALNPGKIFETLNAHQQSAALRGAIELGLFTQIAAGHCTADRLAEACHADARAIRILCDFLVVHEFLAKQDGQYQLSPVAAEFLDQGSPKYMGSIARFINCEDQLVAFRDIAEVVRRGTTLLAQRGTTDTEYDGWVEFARSMVPMIMPAAKFIGSLAAELKPGTTRVLDVAAGHGMFGISVAQANSQATIVSLDWENVLVVANENAIAAGVRDRVSMLAGDATRIEYGSGFDLVLLTNFLHHFDRTTCESVMTKVGNCLHDDGCVITLEFVPNEDRVSPPTAASFALTMLGTTPAGDAYTFSDYDSMWKSTGFTQNELVEMPNSPQRLIVSRR